MKKRILAILCMVCVLASSVSLDIPMLTKADTVYAEESSEESLKELTLSDLGISSGTTASGNIENTYKNGFDNTLVSFYDKVSKSSNYPRIHFGSYATDDWKTKRTGIGLLFDASGDLIISGTLGFAGGDTSRRLSFDQVTIQASDFGYGNDGFFGQRILFQFQTQFMALDADGVKNDIRFTVFINKTRATIIDIKDQADKLGGHILFCEGTHAISGYKAFQGTEESKYERWTYSDVSGVASATLSGTSGTSALSGSLNETYFQAKMTFPSGQFNNFYIGEGDWYGLAIVHHNENPNGLRFRTIATADKFLCDITPEMLGKTTLREGELNLGISVKFIDVNTSTQTGRLKVGIWIDGVLCNGEYYTSEVVTLAKCIKRIHTYAIQNVKIASVTSRAVVTMPTDFTKYTLADTIPTFTTANANTGDVNGFLPGDSLDKVVYSTWMKGATNSTQFHYGSNSTDYNYAGITVYPASNTNIQLLNQQVAISGFVKATNIYAAEALGEGKTFNNEFLLQLTTEYVDSDFDGEKDDLKFGVWFDGRLYRGQYFYYANAVKDMGMRVNAHGGGATFCSYYEELPESMAGYKKWTYSDVCVEDKNTDNVWEYTVTTGATLDASTFQGYATFENGSRYVLLGTTRHYDGFGFASNTDGTLSFGLFKGSFNKYITISPADYEKTTFLNQEVKLGVATRLLKVNADNTVLVEAIPLVNDKVASRKSWMFTLDGDQYARNMALVGDFSIRSTEDAAEEALPENLTTLELEDFGLENELACWQGNGIYNGDSFDDTILSLRVNFGDGLGRIHWAQKDGGYTGFALYRFGDDLVMGSDLATVANSLYYQIGSSTITPESVGLDSFEDVELNIDLVTQYINMDYDGLEDDAKIGVYINGKLANGVYLYAIDALEHLGLGFGVNEANVFTIASTDSNIKTIPEGLKKITLSDARIGIGSGNKFGKFVNIESLEGTLFSAKLKFNQNGSRMHLGLNNDSDNAYTGIGIRLENDKLIIGNEQGEKEGALSNMGLYHIVIEPKHVGLGDTFVDQEFLFQMSVEFVDHDNTGKKDDIKLGVIINDVFYANTYFYVMNQAHLLGTKINFNEGGAASHAPYGDEFVDLGEKNYTELTARDFMFADKTFTKSSVMHTYDYNSLGGKAFSANLTFSEEMAGDYAMYLGGDMWSGLRVEARANGKLRFSHVHNDGAQTIIAEIKPEDVGMTTFFNKKFNLRVTFDVVDGEQDYVNYRLGIYINGQQYNDSYCWVKHVDKSALTETLFIYTVGGGSLSLESTNPKVDFTICGATADTWKKLLNLK